MLQTYVKSHPEAARDLTSDPGQQMLHMSPFHLAGKPEEALHLPCCMQDDMGATMYGHCCMHSENRAHKQKQNRWILPLSGQLCTAAGHRHATVAGAPCAVPAKHASPPVAALSGLRCLHIHAYTSCMLGCICFIHSLRAPEQHTTMWFTPDSPSLALNASVIPFPHGIISLSKARGREG